MSNENALLELFESNNLTPKFETLEENKVTKKVWLDGFGWGNSKLIKKLLKCRSKITMKQIDKIAKKIEKERKRIVKIIKKNEDTKGEGFEPPTQGL